MSPSLTLQVTQGDRVVHEAPLDKPLVLGRADVGEPRPYAEVPATADRPAKLVISPHEEFESVSTCTAPADVDIIRLLGHMHEWGTYYHLERLDDGDQPVETVIEKEWDPVFTSDPEILTFEPAAPMHIAAGTRLRQTCRWFNDTADPILFPREMCLAYGLYFPDDGEIFCDPD